MAEQSKRKKLTTYDYLASKGKRQLSNLFVHSVDEAAAAEEAGIDYIVTAHDPTNIWNNVNIR